MFNQIFFSNLLILETIGILSIGIYAWQKRAIPGASVLFAICMATSFYSFGYGMELRSQTINAVDFWSKIQYLGLPFIPLLWVVLAQKYTRIGRDINGWFFICLALPGVLTSLFRWTSDSHHLMYGTMTLVSNGSFKVLSFEKGLWYYLHFAYFFAMATYSVQKYIRAGRKSVGYTRQHMVIMATASMMPFISITINLLNAFPYQMDSGPFFILFDYFLFTIGIFRYNIQVIGSLSRHRVFEWIADAVIVIDTQYRLIDFNRSASECFPMLQGQLISNYPEPFWKAYPELLELLKFREQSTPKNRVFELKLSLQTKPEPIWYEIKLRDLYLGNKTIGTAILLTDISKTKNLVGALEALAQHDYLTNLFNRRHFIETSTKQMSTLNPGDFYSLAIFDIDHFKQVNDRYGHITGDFVLKWISQRLITLVEENGICGRYGGEEFIIFLPHLSSQDVLKLLEQIRTDFSQQMLTFNDHTIRFTASFGFTIHPFKQMSADHFDTLVMEADEALYHAKETGRNRVCQYEKTSE